MSAVPYDKKRAMASARKAGARAARGGQSRCSPYEPSNITGAPFRREWLAGYDSVKQERKEPQ